jgi:SAM-dependent methyltransferase
MRFPNEDNLWTSTLAFVEANRLPEETIIGPDEFSDRVSNFTSASLSFEQPLDRFAWVLVHKGQLGRFETEFLKTAAGRYRPVFANEVFVVLAANGGPPSIASRDEHLAALHENLSSLQANTWRSGASVTTRFELQPYVQPVPDHVLRNDPRDRLNQICDISDWRDGPMQVYLSALLTSGVIHRKAWEGGKCLWGLDRLGALGPKSHVLSVGAGMERILFYLANRVERVAAADLYREQADTWGWGVDCLSDPSKYAPFPYREEALEVHDMSALDLRFPDSSFDVVYTLSSIEHFGGDEMAAAAMREMARVTKPGGIVCVATELLLSTEAEPECFTLPALRQHLIESGDLRLIEPDIDTRISESLLAHPCLPGRDPDGVSPHIVLAGHPPARTAWTSVILFFRR